MSMGNSPIEDGRDNGGERGAQPPHDQDSAGVNPLNELAMPQSMPRPEVSTDAGLSHQEIGQQMKLFVQVPFAPGAPILLPNGFKVYSILQSKIRELLASVGGYQEVRGSVLIDQSLLKTSGHMDKYAENIFAFTQDDDHLALKPMNCPIHMMIYDMEPRSYRELPIRFHDESTLHRRESRGSLNCMARLQQFHQDDSHIFLAPEQLPGEIARLLGLIDRVYRGVGMEYTVRLSTRPEKFIGDPAVWEIAESTLRNELARLKPDFTVDEGGGAFYGPKIDVDVQAANGRKWQVATSQLDMNLPERFDLKFVDRDGTQKRPVVIHSAIYGALERFMALFTEHTQGNFPTWLAPEQVRIMPVSNKFAEYADRVLGELKALGFRASIDDSGSLSSRMQLARPMRVPYTAVVGAREQESTSLAVRQRGSRESTTIPLAEFKDRLARENNFHF